MPLFSIPDCLLQFFFESKLKKFFCCDRKIEDEIVRKRVRADVGSYAVFFGRCNGAWPDCPVQPERVTARESSSGQRVAFVWPVTEIILCGRRSGRQRHEISGHYTGTLRLDPLSGQAAGRHGRTTDDSARLRTGTRNGKRRG